MKVPMKLRPFLSSSEWLDLSLGDLDPDDRKDVLDILLAAFLGEDPKKVRKKDIADVLRHVKSLVADLLVTGDDDSAVSKGAAIAAEQTAKVVLKDFKVAKRTRRIAWTEVSELAHLGHGVRFEHDSVPDTAIAFIQGFDWEKDRKRAVPVLLLKLEARPANWNSIVKDVKRAVSKFLKGPLKDGELGPRVRSHVNG